MKLSVALNPALTPRFIMKLVHEGGDPIGNVVANDAAQPLMMDIIPFLAIPELVKLPGLTIRDPLALYGKGERPVLSTPQATALCLDLLEKWFVEEQEIITNDEDWNSDSVAEVLAEFSTSEARVSTLCNHQSPLVREKAARNALGTEEDKVMVALMAPASSATL